MKGKNELHISQATMVEAINVWLAGEFKTPPVAVEIRSKVTQSTGASAFIVVVKEPESKGAEQ